MGGWRSANQQWRARGLPDTGSWRCTAPVQALSGVGWDKEQGAKDARSSRGAVRVREHRCSTSALASGKHRIQDVGQPLAVLASARPEKVQPRGRGRLGGWAERCKCASAEERCRFTLRVRRGSHLPRDLHPGPDRVPAGALAATSTRTRAPGERGPRPRGYLRGSLGTRGTRGRLQAHGGSWERLCGRFTLFVSHINWPDSGGPPGERSDRA